MLLSKPCGSQSVKHEKHLFVAEIEKYLMEDDSNFSKSSQLKTALIVSFMLNVRKIDTTQCQIFKDVLAKIMEYYL